MKIQLFNSKFKKNNENHRTPRQNLANHENSIIAFQIHENNEIHRIPIQNNEKHEDSIIPLQN